MFRHIPAAITLFVLTAQFSELVKAIEHVTVLEILVTIAVFTLWIGTRAGKVGEL